MQSFVSLLRGINVGGKNLVSMEKLRSLYESLKLGNPRTYLQSGNVVFESSLPNYELATFLSKKIEQSFNVKVPVIIRSHDDLARIVENVPYAKKDLSSVHVTFLSEKPKDFPKEAIDGFVQNGEKYQMSGTEIYLMLPIGYGMTKLTNNLFEKKLRLTATTRNWNTMAALLKMTAVK